MATLERMDNQTHSADHIRGKPGKRRTETRHAGSISAVFCRGFIYEMEQISTGEVV